MFDLTVNDAINYCNGYLIGDRYNLNTLITKIEIDSRNILGGEMFVAFKGINSDGHDYINAAFEKGASCALVNHAIDDPKGPIIIVDDVQEALKNIVSKFREHVNIPVIGVTGSVGKTTTKEMIASVLSQHYIVHKTKLNLNNTIGLPMSISNIQKNDEVSIVEMGINHFGEMRYLSYIAKPSIAVFTTIGHAHLEFLNDLNGVYKAKTEMLENLKEDSLIIYNGDDLYLKRLSNCKNTLSYGFIKDCDFFYENGVIIYKNREIKCSPNNYGTPYIYASLAATACGIYLGLSDEEISNGLENYEIVGRRGTVINTGYLTLIDDSYNANPDSMKSAIDTLSTYKNRKICILGDMLEQGDKSIQFHKEIGEYAIKKGIDIVLSSGNYGKYISNNFYLDLEDLCFDLKNILKENDVVLVKASRANHFEKVADFIKGINGQN